MSRLDFSTLDFLPFPMLDSSKEHFKDFLSSYGTVTSENDRPSSNLKMATTEEDAKNKSLLAVIKVRNTIKCVDCQKPRCIYAGKALSPSQATALQHIKEAEMYKCGSVLFPRITWASDCEDNTRVRDARGVELLWRHHS